MCSIRGVQAADCHGMLPLSTRWYVSGVPQALQKFRSATFELKKVDGRPRVQRTLANAMNG
jgi:hypothetical protein